MHNGIWHITSAGSLRIKLLADASQACNAILVSLNSDIQHNVMDAQRDLTYQLAHEQKPLQLQALADASQACNAILLPINQMSITEHNTFAKHGTCTAKVNCVRLTPSWPEPGLSRRSLQ